MALHGVRRPRLTRAAFEALVEKALAGLPRRFLSRLDGVEIAVRSRPGREAGRFASPRLLGLYVGAGRPGTPARVVLYQAAIEGSCRSEAEAAGRIAAVLRHEIGHHFGLEDERLRELGH